ncbi:MAG TPA: kelch repeat-containing protein, partial [bacterium]
DNKPSNAVEAFDPLTGQWQRLAPLPTARWQAGAAEVGGKVYVIGGRTGKNDLSDVVEAYDVRANTWAARGKAPFKRAALAAVSMGSVIYVLGGETKDVGVSFLSVKSGEQVTAEYDPVGDRWASKAPAPTGRFGPAAVAVGRKIYVFGGLVGTSLMRSPARHYDVYDQGADRWLGGQSMPRGRANHAAAFAGNRVYVIGGSGDGGMLVDELR